MIYTAANTWDFSVANYGSVWGLLLQLGMIFTALLVGNILRNVIPFLRKGLVPSSLIGGFVLLIVLVILNNVNVPLFEEFVESFQTNAQVITYHSLAIGFIAMTLKFSLKEKDNKEVKVKVLENSFLTGGTYMLQAVFGLGVTIIYYLITKAMEKPLFYSSGILLPLSFGQGPGNALSWDINFSKEYSDLFSGNGSFGLSLASIGFIVASVVGVVYINYHRSKGKIERKMTVERVERNIDVFEQNNEIPDSESIDKFSIQVAIVALVYGVAFLIMWGLGSISSFISNIAWSFNFLFGILVAIVFKAIYSFFKKKNVIKRKYVNNYQMERISGFAFDVMIVAGVAAIKINDIAGYILPIVILSLVGTLITYLYVRFVTKHCYKGYEHEMFVTNFGTLTGTASNGMILLKEIDPNYETPAASLFVKSQVTSMITVAPLLLLISFSAKSLTNALIALAIFAALFIGYTLFLFRKTFSRKKDKDGK